MNFKVLKAIGLGVVILLLFSCSAVEKKATDSNSWSSRMQGLAQNLYVLYPLASDPLAFRDPSNHGKINNSLTSIALMAHEMNKDISPEKLNTSDVDPAVTVLAGTFRRELNTAVDAFRKGDYDYARISTRGALQLCIQCHARKPNDQYRAAILDPQSLASMKPLYRADWFAAARHFDESLDTYKDVIKDQELIRSHVGEWQDAAQRAVAIAVRTKQDPVQTEKIIDLILQAKQAPHYFLTLVQQWKAQVQDWKSDLLRNKLSENDYERAKNIITQTKKRDPLFATNGGSYISYLRATSYLHSYLRETDDHTQLAQTYLLLGQYYDALRVPGEVGLSKNYYKSCILILPHSDTALRCYDQYEESDYSEALTGMTPLPLSTVDYLEYLKNLATP